MIRHPGAAFEFTARAGGDLRLEVKTQCSGRICAGGGAGAVAGRLADFLWTFLPPRYRMVKYTVTDWGLFVAPVARIVSVPM